MVLVKPIGAPRTGQRTVQPPRLLRTALAGLILGFGSVTAGTGIVHASEGGALLDFFGRIFGVTQTHQAAQPEPRRPRRYASLPDARRVSAVRRGPFTARPAVEASTLRSRSGGRSSPDASGIGAAGIRTVCVRTCDGYLFPLGTLRAKRDLPVHQAACAAACPSAPTDLFTLAPGQGELDQAVSLAGQPYLAAAWANVYRRKRVENCHCQEPGHAAQPLPIDEDPTLRVGDVIATGPSAGVVATLARGAVTIEDYRTSRRLTNGARRAVDLRIGALQRDAEARAFRRSLRLAGAGPVRVAEARVTQIRMSTAGGGADPVPSLSVMQAPAAMPGFAPVRVLVPSPFRL